MAQEDVSAQDMANAVAAGWNPEDGPPPNKHGSFQEGLAAGTRLDQIEEPSDAG